MRVDVALTPADRARQDVGGRTVFVVDILRATTTIAAALHHGATAVIPVPTPDAARQAALARPGALLAGERNCERIPGFDLGNSPLEMRARTVGGRTVVLCTTNGTGAFAAAATAARVYALAAVNFTVAVMRARALIEEPCDLLVLCAGREGAFGLDDAYVAGRFIRAVFAGKLRGHEPTDAALAAAHLARHHGNRWDRLLRLSSAGRRLRGLGFGDDVAMAGRQDEFPVLAEMKDGRITGAT